MNPRFTELLALLNADKRSNVTEEDLVLALHVVSAHRGLRGICLALRYFFLFADERGDEFDFKSFRLTKRFKLLRRISRLTNAPEHYWSGYTSEKSRPLPVRPDTGDSFICELFLLEAELDEHETNFKALCLWMSYLCIHYHQLHLDLAFYSAYLTNTNDKVKDWRPTSTTKGNILYDASRRIKYLGNASEAERVKEILRYGLTFEKDANLKLCAGSIFVNDRHDPALFFEAFQSDEDELDHLREWHDGVLPNEIGRFLRAIWGEQVETPYRPPGRGHNSSRTPKLISKTRTIGSEFTEHVVKADIPIDEHSCEFSIMCLTPNNLHGAGTRTINPLGNSSGYSSEPSESSLDDCVRLLLSNQGPGKKYIHNQSIAHHYERIAAKLPWHKGRLGTPAIRQLLEKLQPQVTDTAEQLWCKLVITISLLTGRHVNQLNQLQIYEKTFTPSEQKPVGINRVTSDLIVFASSPSLKSDNLANTNGLKQEHTNKLVVPLPEIVKDQLECLGRVQGNTPMHPRKLGTIIKKTPRFLRSISTKAFQVTAETVATQLIDILYREKIGDLGFLRALTGFSGINAVNILHYSSYNVTEAEQLLYRCQSEILFRPACYLAPSSETNIGCRDAFKPDAISLLLTNIRAEHELAIGNKDEIRAFNLITSYVALWLNLATAGRASQHPSPICIVNGQAIISDKHRQDGSTIRKVPLTTAFQEQLKSYLALCQLLAMQYPNLQPLSTRLEDGMIKFHFIVEDRVKHYTPTLMAKILDSYALDSNWGRKYFRQQAMESGEIARIIDAVMGHGVRGRRWDSYISNMAMKPFNEKVLIIQQEIEQRLELTPLIEVETESSRAKSWPTTPVKRSTTYKNVTEKPPARQYPIPTVLPDNLDHLLESYGEESCKEFARAQSIVSKIIDAALENVRDQIKPADMASEIRNFLYQLCEYLRNKHGIPISVANSAKAFSKEWETHIPDLVNLAFFHEHLLPKYKLDLEQIPPASGDPGSFKRELGRFTMICIWRLGLDSWPLIWNFINTYADSKILITGEAKYLEIEVLARRNRAIMKRTVFIDDFSLTYLLTKARVLKPMLQSLIARSGSYARSQVQQSLKAYTGKMLPESPPLLLGAMTGAAKQHLLLNAAPSIAAYAAGEYETHDLGDNAIRRLSGFAPRVYQTPTKGASLLKEESMQADPVQIEEILAERKGCQMLKVCRTHSESADYWLDKIKKTKANNSAENCFLKFARWHIQNNQKLGTKQYDNETRRQLKALFLKVAYALSCLVTDREDDQFLLIDGESFNGLVELVNEQQLGIDLRSALSRLSEFLQTSQGKSVACQENIQLGEFSSFNLEPQSNNIFSLAELSKVLRIAESALSPVSSPQYKEAAIRFLKLLITFGLRRNEATGLRGIDHQGEFIRVQAYGDHTIKTAAADRILPLVMLQEALAWLAPTDRAQIINPDPDSWIKGDNIYDPLNKLCQRVTGDDSLHLHSIRHTKASSLFLQSVSESAPLENLTHNFPWISDIAAEQASFDCLVGNEGQTGHGLQAISTLLGHAHPSTTQRYYIHTNCFALYSALRELDDIDPYWSFDTTLMSERTMFAKRRSWDSLKSLTAKERQTTIYRDLATLAIKSHKDLVDIDTRKLKGTYDMPKDKNLASNNNARHSVSFNQINEFEISTRAAALQPEKAMTKELLEALKHLSNIPSGKKGSNVPRLRMDRTGLCPLPEVLSGPTAKEAAIVFAGWLEKLRIEKPDDFKWLLDKFIYCSEKRLCRVKLDNKQEAQRWKRLSSHKRVQFSLDDIGVSKTRAAGSTKPTIRGRISIPNPDGSNTSKDITAVRWVIMWSTLTSGHLSGSSVLTNITPTRHS